MSAVLIVPPFLQFLNNAGTAPLAGGSVYTYAAGTTTPQATYTDSTGATPAANPVVLDSAGRCTMWGNGSYKFAVYDSLGNLIRTTDGVTTFSIPAADANSFFESFSGDGSTLSFTTSESLGTDSNAIMVFVGGAPVNPNAYTIAGTTLTFVSAPTTGSNNIFVYAPSLLLGAASSAASAAATSATAAASSASAASTSATNAATSATAAAGSATSASSSASTATTEAGTATTQAGNASTSATAAASSATTAAGSATTATTEAGAAATSATSASSSATSASGSASAASTSASGASTSASNASTSATNAATSATNSANSATASAASAAAAAASAGGFDLRQSCAAAATANIVGTYSNGSSGVGATFTYTATGVQLIDGYTPLLGDRILLPLQTTDLQNGIYTVTTVGALAVAMVLTRSTDYDTPAEVFLGTATLIDGGTVYIGAMFLMTTAGAITIGTTGLAFTQLTVAAPTVTLTGAVTGSGAGSFATTVTNGTFTTALTVNTGTVTLIGNSANTSALTIGAGAVSVSGSNTGDQTNISGNAATVTTNAASTGDATSTGSSNALTLASVNSNTGSFTNANITVNAKGLVTAAASGGASTGRVLSIQHFVMPDNMTVTMTNASPCVITVTQTGHTTGQYTPLNGTPIQFTTTGGLPTGLATATTYYVINSGTGGASKFQVSATKGGSAISTSSAGTGTQKVTNPPYVKTVNNPTTVRVRMVGGGSCNSATAATSGGYVEAMIPASNFSSSNTLTVGLATNSGTPSVSSIGSIFESNNGGSYVADWYLPSGTNQPASSTAGTLQVTPFGGGQTSDGSGYGIAGTGCGIIGPSLYGGGGHIEITEYS